MNRTLTLALFAGLGLVCSSFAYAVDGLVTLKSPHSATDTMNRVEQIAKERGLTVFARIDHAAGASKVGTTLRPTEVLIFGSPNLHSAREQRRFRISASA